jgi:hypothetical protein
VVASVVKPGQKGDIEKAFSIISERINHPDLARHGI